MERILSLHLLLLWRHHSTMHLQDHLSSGFYLWQVIKISYYRDQNLLFHACDLSCDDNIITMENVFFVCR